MLLFITSIKYTKIILVTFIINGNGLENDKMFNKNGKRYFIFSDKCLIYFILIII